MIIVRLAFLVLLELFGFSALLAQSTRVYFGVGGAFHNFQDARWSDVQYTGTSVLPELGFRKVTERSYWSARLDGYFYAGEHPNAGYIQFSSSGFNVRASYLYGITGELYVGGTWNIIDYQTRDVSGLDNESNFFNTASDLLASVRYMPAFVRTENWQLEAGIDLGVLSLVKTAPSFTANFQQKVIDQGEVSFQDSRTRDPFGLEFIEVRPIWNHFFLRTQFEAFFRRRWSGVYRWQMRSLADNRGYPVTMAFHSISFRYHFINVKPL